MKKKIIIAAIYLSGCVCSYVTLRAAHEKYMKPFGIGYKMKDRFFYLGMSTLSWGSFLVGGVLYGIAVLQNNNNLDKPAKW